MRTIEIDDKWVRAINSPLYLVVGALSGVVITFVPFFLYELGKQQVAFGDPRVLTCFAVIFGIGLFYVKLASVVIRQLRSPE